MSTISEIAEYLGLSKSTVSRALRGVPGIAQTTVAAVRARASEIGYIPSVAAAGLSTGRNHAIAVVMPSVMRWYYTAVLTGIDSALADSGYDVVLFDLSRNSARADHRYFHRALLRKRVDAVIVLSTAFTPEEWLQFDNLGIPVVAVGAPTPGMRRIGLDDYEVGRAVTQVMVDLGHTRIGLIGGLDAEGMNDIGANDRERGFLDVLNESRILARDNWIISGGYRLGLTKLAVSRLLDANDIPTALVCASDEMAIGAMYAIQSRGLRVGNDLSVIGIDGHEYAEAFDLSTLVQDPVAQGAQAATQMVAEINGLEPARDFPPATWELVLRASTGPAPA